MPGPSPSLLGEVYPTIIDPYRRDHNALRPGGLARSMVVTFPGEGSSGGKVTQVFWSWSERNGRNVSMTVLVESVDEASEGERAVLSGHALADTAMLL